MLPINRNCPENNAYSDDSFTGLLHEQCHWSDEEYFKLDDALHQLARLYQDESLLPREITWPLMRIFSFVMMTIANHYNKNDLYRIENLTDEQLFERKTRFQQVFEGFFNGSMFPTHFFDYQPPETH